MMERAKRQAGTRGDGNLKGGWRKSIFTRIFAWVMWTFRRSFMIHAELG